MVCDTRSDRSCVGTAMEKLAGTVVRTRLSQNCESRKPARGLGTCTPKCGKGGHQALHGDPQVAVRVGIENRNRDQLTS